MYKIPANTHLVGKQLISVPECHSTNDVLQQLIDAKGFQEGLVVISHHQTRGRGQRGSHWESKAGMNLTFSVALQPHRLEAKDHFLLSMVISLGVSDYLATVFKPNRVNVKWPNDVFVDSKKVCGILIENSISGTCIQHSVAGIGLNVNQEDFAAPNATSMRLLSNKEFELPEVLQDLLEDIEKRYMQLQHDKLDVLRSNYTERLFRRGEEHWFATGEEKFSGAITGVDLTGRLLIRTGEVTRSFSNKEVEFLL